MSETNTESSTTDSPVMLSETLLTSLIPSSSSSSSPSNTVDDETKRRKILSKLWGKGSKLSHKVRELEKSTINNGSDTFIHNDQQQLTDNSNNPSSHSSTNDPKSTTEDNSNSISSSKPLAVVKPIVVLKSGLIVSPAADRTRVNSETSSTTITQVNETTITTMTVNERQSSSSTITTTTTDRTSSKKKKSHKNEDLKKKKTTKDKSNERDRSKDRHHHHHHHHKKDENSSKKDNSLSKNDRREHNEEVSMNDNHHKSSRDYSYSTTSASNSKRRSRSNDVDHSNRKSSRSTTSKKDEPSSSKRSTLSPVDHHSRYSNSKYQTSSHRHRPGSSRTPSPSSSRSRYSTTKRDRSPRKTSLSPKKDDRSSTTTTTTKSNRQKTESISNSKSTNSISPSNSSSNHRRHDANTIDDNDTHRHKPRTNDENLTNSSKLQKLPENSPEHHSSTSSIKQEKSKTIKSNDENNSNRRKLSLSHHDQRSHSRHRSRSKEDKINRKTIESTNSEESSINKTKFNHEKDSKNDNYRRKSSSDYHRYDHHDSPSNYDRRNYYYDDDDDDHHHHHRHSYYPKTHYVHHHHHHHYRSTSSRYHHHHYRRSSSPRSRHPRSRYFSSTSSSISPSPRRRSPSSRTSSSSTRSSSSYSSISQTSSSRSSSRNNHYYHHRHRHHHHEKNFRRSPTLEKLFLKASESIESVSTQKNPNISSSTHLIPVQTSNLNSDPQLPSPMNSLSEPNAFYSQSFSGFSVPPPPFMSQPQQRYLKEITTDSSTSRRLILNEIPLSTSSNVDEVIPIKTIQSNDLSTNVRSGPSKPSRISRFSDITPPVPSDPPLNTNLPVDTPLNYTQISENTNCLPSSRRQQKRHNREVMECECTTSEYDRSRGIKACGHECLNRMLLIECSSNCPCGQWCTNRRFQRRSYANHKLALFKTEMKGYGLRTISSIRKGRFLVEYIGEVIDMDELAKRNKKYKRDGNIHQYVMSLIHGTVIDSTIKGNWARFINHSCEPNCVAEKWLVNGEYRMGIFAKRDLDINEEITIDYRFETFGTVDLANEKCYCGASTCRGTISIKTNNNNNNYLNKRQIRRQPLVDDELLDYLHDDETNEYIIPKTIEDIRQLIQIMSRTDSENVRMIELDLIKNASQKHFELPRLFLECNGLHVLCSWMKDILIDNDIDEQQQYSNEFKCYLLDFIHTILPIKDRTIVSKNGLLDLVYKKLKLPLIKNENIENNDQEQIHNLMNSILNHLDDPIIAKLFQIYSTWMSLKERFIIPKRKESQETSNHHHYHRHHHHHSSKHSYEENNYRLNLNTRLSLNQSKPIERYNGKRSYVVRDIPRTQEQQLSKDERRKLFEQQYEDEEKARAAAATAATNGESPGGQNEPPHKKQRISDGTEAIISNTPPQSQNISMSYTNETDHIYSIHRHLSQIPIEYIRSYMISIGEPISGSNISTNKDEPVLDPPPRPTDENELSRIIRLPSGWSVAMCPSDSSVYFYNQKIMKTSWIPPSLEILTDETGVSLDLSPLSSAQISEQHHSQPLSSSSRSILKLSRHPHRHSRSHRHHYHHHNHHMSSNNKRKRPSEIESTTSSIKNEPHPQSIENISIIISNEQIKQEDININKSVENIEEISDVVPKVSIDENNQIDQLTIGKESSEINENIEEQMSSNNNILSSSLKLNRDILRKNISQHVHTTLKPYTKRTCKQGRIVSTDDIKYLVKKFTLAVLDKEIEKAKNEGIPLSPILTDRVRLKTEVYVKKYMNKMGSVFQRHDTAAHSSSQSSLPPPPPPPPTTTSNAE